MINDTLDRLQAAISSVSDAKKKAELNELMGLLKSDLGKLQEKHEDLRLSLQGFESTHPQLTEAVNELCGFLAKLGI